MLTVSTGINLQNLHSFHMNYTCDEYCVVNCESDLIDVLKHNPNKNKYIIGNGTNTIFTSDYHGLVIHNQLMEFKVLKEDNINVIVNVGAGVQWQDFVEWAVENRYYGLENMSWIPGTIGAAPINNIGAYGVEVAPLITDVYGIYLDTLQHIHLTNKECAFRYRNSVFKQDLKNKIIITNVTFCLSKQKHYITVHKALSHLDLTMEIDEVVKIIHDIRLSKIPDPNVLSNVGSFFKNPIMHYDNLQQILNKYPNIPFYHCSNGTYKVPVAAIIEQCGLKDYRINDIGFAKTHSDVVINYGEGTGCDLYAFIDEIKRKVFDSCSILLDVEPTIL